MNLRRLIQCAAIASVLLTSIYGQKPTRPPKSECGTKLTESQIQMELKRAAGGPRQTFAPQLNRPIWIPLSIHVIRETNGSGGLTDADLKVAMTDLNRLWLPVGVQYFQNGNVDVINDSYFYTIPDDQGRRDEMRFVNPFPNTINVYFVGELTNLCGQSSFSTDPIQGILMDKDCVGAGNSPSTLAHEIGHYFDLYHTHETIFGVECPSGSNCGDAGDLLCDTPADPTLNDTVDVNEACAWTGSAATPPGCGGAPYNPSTRNIMSYSRKVCRDVFTPNQVSRALGTMINARPNLFGTLLRFVAWDGGVNADCSYFSPCRTLTRAIQLANVGDSVFILGGSYPDVILPQNKPVTIRKWNTDSGDVLLGQ